MLTRCVWQFQQRCLADKATPLMTVVPSTEKCRNVEWVCENFRTVNCKVHTVGNLTLWGGGTCIYCRSLIVEMPKMSVGATGVWVCVLVVLAPGSWLRSFRFVKADIAAVQGNWNLKHWTWAHNVPSKRRQTNTGPATQLHLPQTPILNKATKKTTNRLPILFYNISKYFAVRYIFRDLRFLMGTETLVGLRAKCLVLCSAQKSITVKIYWNSRTQNVMEFDVTLCNGAWGWRWHWWGFTWLLFISVAPNINKWRGARPCVCVYLCVRAWTTRKKKECCPRSVPYFRHAFCCSLIDHLTAVTGCWLLVMRLFRRFETIALVHVTVLRAASRYLMIQGQFYVVTIIWTQWNQYTVLSVLQSGL
jgi:hypothetical protein